MADNLTTATIEVRANTRALERDILKALKTVELSPIDTKKSSQALGRISGQVSEFNKSLEASNARVIAFGASAGAIFAVQKALSSLVSSTIEVEKLLTDINVLLNLSSGSLEKFGNSLFSVAKNTGQTFSVVAEAAAELSRQGLGTEETLKRTNAALILTRLSGLDAKTSVEALTATLNSFSETSLDALEVVNKLANVDAAFAVSSGDLANAISRVGSTAQDAGVSLDELVALVTSAQQTTARGGAVIGNSFKTIFTRLQRGKVQGLLESLGVNVGEGQSAVSLLQQLASVYDTLGASQKSAVAEQVGGVFQINILKAALADLGKEYSTYSQALNTSLGATDQATARNEALNKTVSALSNQLAANMQQAASKIGSIVFEPNAKGFLSGINSLLDSFNNIDSESAGGKLMEGFFKGVGNFISGPGAILATGVIVKLFAKLGQFASGSLKELLGRNEATKQQAAMEQSVLSILQKNSDFTNKILTGKMSTVKAEQELLSYLTAQSNILKQQEALSKSIAGNLSRMGVSVASSGVPIVSAAAKATGKIANASGYVPNFASDQVIGQAMEDRGAREHGYKAGRATQTTIHDGNGKSFKSFVNSKEDVINFTNAAGKKATMVRPPNGFGKNTQYAAGGYVPNFVNNAQVVKSKELSVSKLNSLGGTKLKYQSNADGVDTFQSDISVIRQKKSISEYNRGANTVAQQLLPKFSKRTGKKEIDEKYLDQKIQDYRAAGVDESAIRGLKTSVLNANPKNPGAFVNIANRIKGINGEIDASKMLNSKLSSGNAFFDLASGEEVKTKKLQRIWEIVKKTANEFLSTHNIAKNGKGGRVKRDDIRNAVSVVMPSDSKLVASSSGFVPNFAGGKMQDRYKKTQGISSMLSREETAKRAANKGIEEKNLGKVPITMIHGGSDGAYSIESSYTGKNKQTGKDTKYTGTITSAGLSTSKLKGREIQQRVGEALVTSANNITKVFNPSAGEYSSPSQLANSGAVGAAAGTVFESALRKAFDGPAKSETGRIDFPSPSAQLQAFFNNAPVPYEAKITDTPGHRSETLGKYIAVRGLSDGYVPNFAKKSGISFSQSKEDEFGIRALYAKMGGKNVGRLETSQNKDGIIDIGDISVDKANRGKGISSELYKEAIKRNAGKKMKGQLLPQMNRLLEKIKRGEPVSAETLFPQIKRADLAKDSVFEVYGHKGSEVEKMTRDQFSSLVNGKINELKNDPKKLQGYFGNIEADDYGGLSIDLQTQHSSGFVPNFADRRVGYLDGDVLSDPKYASIVEQQISSLNIKGGVAGYHKYLGELVNKSRGSGSLKKFTGIFGVPGAGKSSMMLGGKNSEKADNAKSRKTQRIPIITPSDIGRVDEVIDTRASSVGTAAAIDGGYWSNLDRMMVLSSSTPKEQDEIKRRRGLRDSEISKGVSRTNFGREAGTSSGAGLDSAYIEAVALDILGPEKTRVMGINSNFGLKRKKEQELPMVERKRLGLAYGAFSPSTKGHLEMMQMAKEKGISPEDFVVAVSREGGKLDENDQRSLRTLAFDQRTRRYLAEKTFQGANVVSAGSDFTGGIRRYLEVNPAGDRRKFLSAQPGSTAFVGSDKTEKDFAKYKTAGYDVSVGGRTEGISGTKAREAMLSGDSEAMSRIFPDYVLPTINQITPTIKNRTEIIPEVMRRTSARIDKDLVPIERELASLPLRITKTTPQDVQDKIMALRGRRDELKSQKQKLPPKILKRLSGMFPDKYGIPLSSSGFIPNFAKQKLADSPAFTNFYTDPTKPGVLEVGSIQNFDGQGQAEIIEKYLKNKIAQLGIKQIDGGSTNLPPRYLKKYSQRLGVPISGYIGGDKFGSLSKKRQAAYDPYTTSKNIFGGREFNVKSGGFVPNFAAKVGMQKQRNALASSETGNIVAVHRIKPTIKDGKVSFPPSTLPNSGERGVMVHHLEGMSGPASHFPLATFLRLWKEREMDPRFFARNNFEWYYPDTDRKKQNFSSGFVPNFSAALNDAIAREQSSGLSKSQIYVDAHSSLKNKNNPMGLMVANTRDEPLGGLQGINRAKREGRNPKTYGSGMSSGFVPNFALGGRTEQETGEIKALSDELKVIDSEIANRKAEIKSREKKLEALRNDLKAGTGNAEAVKQTKALENENKGYEQAKLKNPQLTGGMDSKIAENNKKIADIRNQQAEAIKKEIQSTLDINKSNREILNEKSKERETVSQSLNTKEKETSRTGKTKRFLGNNALTVGFGLQSIASSAAGALGNEETRAGRMTRAGGDAVGTIAGFAGTGAMFGPVGAGIGLAVGVLKAGSDLMKEYNTQLPDLIKASEKSSETFNKFSETGQAVLTLSEKYSQLSSSLDPNAAGEISKVQKLYTEQLLKLSAADRENILSGISRGEGQQAFNKMSEDRGKLAAADKTAETIGTFAEKGDNKTIKGLGKDLANQIGASSGLGLKDLETVQSRMAETKATGAGSTSAMIDAIKTAMASSEMSSTGKESLGKLLPQLERVKSNEGFTAQSQEFAKTLDDLIASIKSGDLDKIKSSLEANAKAEAAARAKTAQIIDQHNAILTRLSSDLDTASRNVTYSIEKMAQDLKFAGEFQQKRGEFRSNFYQQANAPGAAKSEDLKTKIESIKTSTAEQQLGNRQDLRSSLIQGLSDSISKLEFKGADGLSGNDALKAEREFNTKKIAAKGSLNEAGNLAFSGKNDEAMSKISEVLSTFKSTDEKQGGKSSNDVEILQNDANKSFADFARKQQESIENEKRSMALLAQSVAYEAAIAKYAQVQKFGGADATSTKFLRGKPEEFANREQTSMRVKAFGLSQKSDKGTGVGYKGQIEFRNPSSGTYEKPSKGISADIIENAKATNALMGKPIVSLDSTKMQGAIQTVGDSVQEQIVKMMEDYGYVEDTKNKTFKPGEGQGKVPEAEALLKEFTSMVPEKDRGKIRAADVIAKTKVSTELGIPDEFKKSMIESQMKSYAGAGLAGNDEQSKALRDSLGKMSSGDLVGSNIAVNQLQEAKTQTGKLEGIIAAVNGQAGSLSSALSGSFEAQSAALSKSLEAAILNANVGTQEMQVEQAQGKAGSTEAQIKDLEEQKRKIDSTPYRIPLDTAQVKDKMKKNAEKNPNLLTEERINETRGVSKENYVKQQVDKDKGVASSSFTFNKPNAEDKGYLGGKASKDYDLIQEQIKLADELKARQESEVKLTELNAKLAEAQKQKIDQDAAVKTETEKLTALKGKVPKVEQPPVKPPEAVGTAPTGTAAPTLTTPVLGTSAVPASGAAATSTPQPVSDAAAKVSTSLVTLDEKIKILSTLDYSKEKGFGSPEEAKKYETAVSNLEIAKRDSMPREGKLSKAEDDNLRYYNNYTPGEGFATPEDEQKYKTQKEKRLTDIQASGAFQSGDKDKMGLAKQFGFDEKFGMFDDSGAKGYREALQKMEQTKLQEKKDSELSNVGFGITRGEDNSLRKKNNYTEGEGFASDNDAKNYKMELEKLKTEKKVAMDINPRGQDKSKDSGQNKPQDNTGANKNEKPQVQPEKEDKSTSAITKMAEDVSKIASEIDKKANGENGSDSSGNSGSANPVATGGGSSNSNVTVTSPVNINVNGGGDSDVAKAVADAVSSYMSSLEPEIKRIATDAATLVANRITGNKPPPTQGMFA